MSSNFRGSSSDYSSCDAARNHRDIDTGRPGGERESERQRQRHTDRQTDREANRNIDRQKESESQRLAHTGAERKGLRQR